MFLLNTHGERMHIKHRCPVPTLVSLCKHVLAKHCVTPDQTQSSMQKGPTAALNYINYHRQNTHSLSLSLQPLAPAIISDLFNKLKKMQLSSFSPAPRSLFLHMYNKASHTHTCTNASLRAFVYVRDFLSGSKPGS